jgi:hypothetical protein
MNNKRKMKKKNRDRNMEEQNSSLEKCWVLCYPSSQRHYAHKKEATPSACYLPGTPVKKLRLDT